MSIGLVRYWTTEVCWVRIIAVERHTVNTIVNCEGETLINVQTNASGNRP